MIITRLSRASWFKIKMNNLVIHLDPGYTGYFQNQRIPEMELDEKADMIFISHHHKDHLQPEAIQRIIKKETILIAPANCEDRLQGLAIRFIQAGQSFEMKGIKVEAVDAYNTQEGRSTRKVHHKGDFVGYLLYINSRVIYFAGDTDFIPEMKCLDAVDVAFLPIGGTFVMDPAEAADAVVAIKPKMVIPMHESKNDPAKFRREVTQKSDAKVMILKVGDKIDV